MPRINGLEYSIHLVDFDLSRRAWIEVQNHTRQPDMGIAEQKRTGNYEVSHNHR